MTFPDILELGRTVRRSISRSISPEPRPSSPAPVRSDETTLSLITDAADTTDKTDTCPSSYLSVRVTVSHIDVSKLLLDCFSDIEYICYKHKGAKTKKEHVHILVPEHTKKDVIRKRLTRAGFTGNGQVCYKVFHNGLLCGIQYASKEGTEPIVTGPFDEYIKSAPKWNYRAQTNLHSHFSTTESYDKGLRDWQLTYSNLVPQAVRYAQINKLGDLGLKSVVKHMMSNTKWRPCKHMIVGGVPDFYVKDYMYRMGQAKEIDMEWFCQRN